MKEMSEKQRLVWFLAAVFALILGLILALHATAPTPFPYAI
jgi:hypothetical protein